MGRKSSAKGKNTVQPAPAQKQKFNPLLLGVLALAVVAAGVLVMRGGSSAPESGTAASAGTGQAQTTGEVIALQVDRAEANARFGPREQSSLPPIPFQAYAPPRPMEVVTAAYEFAAEHPEILSYVPCFCGCENAGHGGNHDCFVRSRNANGDVTAWDEHGVECTVCIDVANRSRQLHASGASVIDIRSAIEKEFGPVYSGHTPTPAPPGAND